MEPLEKMIPSLSIQKATYQCAMCHPLELTHTRVHTHILAHACMCTLPPGAEVKMASHIRWMNSRSVLPAVCSLPPKESSRDSDGEAWSGPHSLLPAREGTQGHKMESGRENIDLQVSSLREEGRGDGEQRCWGQKGLIFQPLDILPLAPFLTHTLLQESLGFPYSLSLYFPVWVLTCSEIREKWIL